MSDRVIAIVVTYNANLETLQRLLNALVPQVDCVYIVDNGSQNIESLRALVDDRVEAHVQVCALPSNQGLGAAHNKGIEWAKANDYSHVLIMDQDSIPQSNMVDNLIAAWHQCSAEYKVSAVGARYLNRQNQSASFFIRFGALKFQRHYCKTANAKLANQGASCEEGRYEEGGCEKRDCEKSQCIEADFLISSGSLISLHSLQEIGLMDENLFIDHVDTEWFLRAKHKGFKAFGICNAVMEHDLGEQTHKVKLIRERNVPQHKPFRYYYIFRNSVLLYRRGYCSSLWKWNDVQRLAMIAIMYGVFCPPRWQHITMMFKGIVDGIKGSTGASHE